jgi:hypothetical protein
MHMHVPVGFGGTAEQRSFTKNGYPMNGNARTAEHRDAVVGPRAEFASRPPQRPIAEVRHS